MWKERIGIDMSKNIFASILISQNLDIKPINITNLLDSVTANENNEIKCSILLKTRLFGIGRYRIFFVLECIDKFRVLDSFDIIQDEDEGITKYNKAYDLEDFYIPTSKNNCVFKVFGITQDEYDDFINKALDKEDPKELLDYLEIADCNLLDKDTLYIDKD